MTKRGKMHGFGMLAPATLDISNRIMFSIWKDGQNIKEHAVEMELIVEDSTSNTAKFTLTYRIFRNSNLSYSRNLDLTFTNNGDIICTCFSEDTSSFSYFQEYNNNSNVIRQAESLRPIHRDSRPIYEIIKESPNEESAVLKHNFESKCLMH